MKLYLYLGVVFFFMNVNTNIAQQQSPITDPKVTEVWEPEPNQIIAYDRTKAPSDAIVLFERDHANAWIHSDGKPLSWIVEGDIMTVNPGSGEIRTKEEFGSCQIHLEWRSPDEPAKEGQGKGNSGIFLAGKYEVQILNSYQNRTYSNGQAASIYKQHIPLVNATSPTGQWNYYDIIYHAPEFDKYGNKSKSGTITVLHNGVLVQDHVELLGTTEYIGYPKNTAHGDGPILLQDHSNKVSFRNIWVRRL